MHHLKHVCFLGPVASPQIDPRILKCCTADSTVCTKRVQGQLTPGHDNVLLGGAFALRTPLPSANAKPINSLSELFVDQAT